MAAPAVTDFADMVAGTLKELGPLNAMSQIAQSKQRYEVLSKWMKEDKTVLSSGTQIQRSLMVSDSGAAAHVQPTEEDNVNIVDLMKVMTVNWVHAQTSWAVVYQHTLMNRSPSQIFDAIATQRVGSMLSLHDEIENKVWGTHPSTTNTTDPWGVKYWVVQNSATGFNGGAPSGHTTVGGIDPATYTTFKNYTGTYAATGGNSKADLIKKMRDAHHYCNFVSPVDVKDYMSGTGNTQRVYANRTTVSGFEDIGEAQNESLGRDIASIDGWSLAFRGHPIRTISALDSDSNNPVYMLNHESFFPVVLKGDYLRETRNMAPKQHNIEQYFVDLTYNFLCVNRRANAVFYGA